MVVFRGFGSIRFSESQIPSLRNYGDFGLRLFIRWRGSTNTVKISHCVYDLVYKLCECRLLFSCELRVNWSFDLRNLEGNL